MSWIPLLIASPAFVGGIAFLLAELRTAPEAFEDEDGFQMIWRNNRPEIEDVACIWQMAPSVH
jgi:hypothetical protein